MLEAKDFEEKIKGLIRLGEELRFQGHPHSEKAPLIDWAVQELVVAYCKERISWYMNKRREDPQYQALRDLTAQAREEIFEYAMQRSDEIIRGKGEE